MWEQPCFRREPRSFQTVSTDILEYITRMLEYFSDIFAVFRELLPVSSESFISFLRVDIGAKFTEKKLFCKKKTEKFCKKMFLYRLTRGCTPLALQI
jgi:hypothetical protein